MKKILVELDEYNADLNNATQEGYAMCLKHLKIVKDTGTIQISENTDKETRELWEAVIDAFKKLNECGCMKDCETATDSEEEAAERSV